MSLPTRDFTQLLETFREYLYEHVPPHHCEFIAMQCKVDGFLTEAEYTEILHTENCRRTSRLIQILCQRQQPGLFQSFISSLRAQGLDYVAQQLIGDPVSTSFFQDYYTHVVTVFYGQVSNEVKASDILDIYGPELLDDHSRQVIEAQPTEIKKTAKLLYLISKRPGMLEKFIERLRSTGVYGRLLQILEGGTEENRSFLDVFLSNASLIEEQLEPRDILDFMDLPNAKRDHIHNLEPRDLRVKSFLDILVNQPFGWFKNFVSALRRPEVTTDYFDLIEVLDPESTMEDIPSTSRQGATSVAEKEMIAEFSGTSMGPPGKRDDNAEPPGPSSDANVGYVFDVPYRMPLPDSRRSPSPSPAENCLELTSEQKELARDALKGENCVIVAPTGYGKTYVAFYICQEHLKLGPGLKRVVILAPTGPILDQHYANLKLYFDESKYKMAKLGGGGAARTPSAAILESSQIVVMTPKKLLNAMNEDKFDFGQISLLIFDECHHAVKNEPYNEIMEHYFRRMSPRREDRLPQIVGLTATPGSGEASNTSSAVDHVITLLANLDVTIAPLEVASSSMSFEPIAVKRPTQDQVWNTIIQMMKIIEKKVKSLINENKNVLETGFKFEPSPRLGYPDYENEIVALDKRCDSVGDVDLSQKLRICAKYLRTFNDALLMSELLRPVDAKDFIEEKFFDHQSTSPIERKMKELYDKSGLAQKADDRPSALLQEAIDLLKRHFETKPDSRCIVFVKTRKTAQMLSDCFSEDPSLIRLSLNPTYFTGTNAKTTDGGLTKSQQADHLLQFRFGDSKLLVSTNVAEEGINIPACNLVIAYNYCSNDVGQVQRQGRARVKDSKMYLLSYGDRKFIERERANLARNQLVSKALQQLKHMDPEALREKVKDIQSKRIPIKITSASKPSSLPSNQVWKLLCNCGLEVTTSDKFRLKKDHHVIVDREFASKARVDQKTRTIRCAKPDCNRKWGSNMQMRHDVPMPVLDISCFTLVKDDGTITRASKWNKAPFKVEKELDGSDIAVLIGESADAVSDQESSLDDYSLDF